MNSTLARRRFLQGVAAAAASAALPIRSTAFAQLAQRPTLPKSPVRLGLATYTFRKFDTAKMMEFAHELRTPYLNVKDMHLKMGSAEEVKQQADALRAGGFQLTSAGNVNLQKDDEADIRAKFEYLKAAGITTMVGIPTHASLPRVEKCVKEYNIRLAIHNHGPEEKEFHSPLEVLDSIKFMDPRLGCCVDVGHTVRSGTDPVEAMRAAGPRLFSVHMKDLAKPDNRDSQVAVGEGLMPVKEIFDQLIRMKYTGFVDLEYEIRETDPLPGAMESFAYMRGVLRGMGYDTAE